MPIKVALITNPASDVVTEYLYSWSMEIIANITHQLSGLDIHELRFEDVTKENLTKSIKEKDPYIVLFHGHGGSRTIYGFNATVLITCDDNEGLLESRIVHSLTCDSGEELGPRCIRAGTTAFVGYKKEFKFNHLGGKTNADQQADFLAGIFLKPALEIDKALLEGNSVEQAFNRSQRIYANNLQAMLTSSNPNVNTLYAARLHHDMINQVILGDQTSSF